MDPRAFRLADRLLYDVDEGRHVMIGDSLALEHLLDEGRIDLRGTGSAGDGVGDRHDAELGPGLDGEELDFEPRCEFGLVAEHRRHLRHGVAGDHAPKLVGGPVGRVGPFKLRTRRTALGPARHRQRSPGRRRGAR